MVWTTKALADLQAIGDHIARDKPGAAARWVMRLTEKAEGVVELPLVGRRVPELGRDDVREVFLRTYRIIYFFTEDRLEILTIFEGHRSFPDDLEPR